ncbi:Multidrug resistance-associated protein 1 [Borealophlyctis nickersoniae]|nr:Multidrug resistance-associated protein 1 [Borealophlyctis nickersoniae]
MENVSKPGAYYLTLDEDLNGSPEETANIFSRLSFYWMEPLMRLGYRKHLEMDDLWNLKKQDRSSYTGARFQRMWDQEVTRKKPSLLRAVARSYGLVFGSAAIFKAFQDTCAFLQPRFLAEMMNFARSWSSKESEPQPVYRGFVIAFLMLLTAITQTLMLHQYFHICLVTGMRLRSAIVSTIYKKALVLSNSGRQTSTVGEIVNLMSVDAGRISDLCSYLHILWSGPFQISMAIYFLYQTLGPAIFAGVAVMILMIPVNVVIAQRSRKLNKAQMSNKDTRTKMMDELLNGIKVIKLYAWERPFLKKIFGVREQELETLKKIGYLSAVQSFTWACTPFLVSFTSFAIYTFISDEPLTSTKVFVSLSLFNLLQFPLVVFPSVITAAIEASVSFGRLSKFLLTEELDQGAVSREPVPFQSPSAKVERVIIEDGSFRWSKEENGAPALENISFSVSDSTLFAIVGSVGAGKSSVIAALLGEMYKSKGKVTVRGSVAYVPQTAWIMNATLKENILFGKPYDVKFYEATIAACGLAADIEMLPGGDSTEIGERGINLSGGQKQRVALARAVYSRADVYLFDDPLSAVDAHVGRHIFDHVVGPKGLLKGKARVFVTHGIHFLAEADVVMMLQEGRISEIGPYNELIIKEGALYSLMKEYGKRKDGEEEEMVEEGEYLSAPASMGSVKSSSGEKKLRRRSSASEKALPEVKAVSAGGTNLIAKEESAKGSVSWDVYVAYAKACSLEAVVFYLIIAVASQALGIAQAMYLADWANENDESHPQEYAIQWAAGGTSVMKRLGVYGALGILFSLTVVGQSIYVWVFCGIRSARTMHEKLLNNITRLPQSFFDTTPLGRIMNRFSKDQYTVDETLPQSFQGYFRTLFYVLAVLAVNAIGSPLFLAFALPLGLLYMHFQRYYLSTSRELKRLDSTSRSPIYAHFSETLGGVSSIRAYGEEKRFITANEHKVDFNLKAYYPSISSNRWLAVRLEFIGSLVIFGSALFSVVTIVINGQISASKSGISQLGAVIKYVFVLMAHHFQHNANIELDGEKAIVLLFRRKYMLTCWQVRQSCEIETNIVSVERIKEYAELPQEAPYEIPGQHPDPRWPANGTIRFADYSTRYREGLDLVLQNISFSVNPKEKIGIVGRTGAGKSSLTLSLFRLVEAAGGSIQIDGLDISGLGLYDLRSRLTIIPQDPVLFAGTIRENLDPFGVYDDAAIWRALESASLKTHVSRLDDKLGAMVLQGGENFSVGQRQLICLARALLRKTKILVLDEATAAIDVETDTIIQKTIRQEFCDCTILTIAHRINTVMDNDRILVLDRGKIAEYDSPANLLRNKKSMFYGLAKESGQAA